MKVICYVNVSKDEMEIRNVKGSSMKRRTEDSADRREEKRREQKRQEEKKQEERR